jgi:hypothetical protein
MQSSSFRYQGASLECKIEWAYSFVKRHPITAYLLHFDGSTFCERNKARVLI